MPIEVITVTWMVIELASGGVLLWRLAVASYGGGTARVGRAEHRAPWVVTNMLRLLCLYVLTCDRYGLFTGSQPEASVAGLAISAAAVLVIPHRARVKHKVATRIQSDALAGDAVNSLTGAYVAGTVLLGLALNRLFGWWWASEVAALLFLIWLVRETLESFEEARRP